MNDSLEIEKRLSSVQNDARAPVRQHNMFR